MKLGSFEVSIARHPENDEGYVVLEHRETYSINLHNNMDRRCAAEVHVDGKHVGTFRLNHYSSLNLERPSGDNGQFTFYKSGSKEAKAAKLSKVSKSELGLVSVTFKPEKRQRPTEVVAEVPPVMPWYPNYPVYRNAEDGPIGSADVDLANSDNRDYLGRPKGALKGSSVSRGPSGQSLSTSSNYSSGGTGLSGSSNQRFRTVGNLDYDDSSTWVTINLRLVSGKSEPRELKSTSNSNPIPRPV
jgi:hypothetical protein